MISVNFPQIDNPIELERGANILIIKDVKVYSQVLYSLYQREEGKKADFSFLIFDEYFKELKKMTVIQNPLLFELNSLQFKKKLFDRIIATLDMDERAKIEETYSDLTQYFNQQVFEDIEIEVSISEIYKLEDLFKLLKITILDETNSFFEKTQLILNVLKEFSMNELIIFSGLSSFLTVSEYNLLIETASLNQQQVLFLENKEVQGLENLKSVTVDEDYVSWEKML